MIFLGVDGGGTKTHALAVNERGEIIGTGIAGRSNYHITSLEQAVSVIADAAQQALGTAHADHAVYCLAGCDTDIDEVRLRQAVTPFGLAKEFTFYNDSFAGLRAGSRHPYGVAVNCGTGFNACGIAPDGRRAKLRSLGPITGDWGGGHDLGQAVFAATFRAEEGRGEPTLLSQLLLTALAMPDLDTLTYELVDDKISVARIGALARLAFEAAEQGDLVARSILLHQADEIVISAMAMLRRLEMLTLEVDVILSGGVFKNSSALLIEMVIAQMAQQCPTAHVIRLEIPPVVGSLLLAFDAGGIVAPSLNFDKSQYAVSSDLPMDTAI
ncbi:MAG: BadF/BadG/BcrA/BcrD ATPase family protein [Chloroflexota bacterium]